ncbi:MAG: hypothetical protein ABIA74_01770 [bacterium]
MKKQKNILLFLTILTFYKIYPNVSVDTSLIPSCWERDYLQKRLTVEKNGIRNFINDQNISDEDLPTIAFVCSGGGCRAMTSTLGFLLGAQQINLINATRYLSVLSGSTWTTAILLALGLNNIESLKEYLKDKMTRNIFDIYQVNNIDNVAKILLQKFSYNENIQPSDFYGSVLISRLMENFNGKEQNLTFRNIRNHLNKNKIFPFPIFTNVITNSGAQNYEWLEINPYTAGCDVLGGFIPTSYFESKFENGNCIHSYPEETLGSFMGLFGSAYSITIQDAEIHTDSEIIDKTTNVLQQIEKQTGLNLTNQRFLDAKINNFSYGIENSFFADQEKLILVDAGMHFNLPFPPLLKMNRNIDIFLVCDASAGEENQLAKAEEYAKQRNIPFPNLENCKKINDSIFIYEEKNAPTIIHFKNPIEMGTMDFSYSEEEFENICNSMATMVVNTQNIISQVIKNKIKNKTDESEWLNEIVYLQKYPETGNRSGWIKKLLIDKPYNVALGIIDSIYSLFRDANNINNDEDFWDTIHI